MPDTASPPNPSSRRLASPRSPGDESGNGQGPRLPPGEARRLLDLARSVADSGSATPAGRLLQQAFLTGGGHDLARLLLQSLAAPAAPGAALAPQDNALAETAAAPLVTQFVYQLAESIRRSLEERADPRGPSPAGRAEADEHGRRALPLLERQQYPEAEAELRKAIALHPARAEFHANLGVLLARTGRLPEAEASFRLAVALDPVVPSAHANLGTACAQRGRHAEAEMAFRQAVQLAPADPQLHQHLAHTLLALRRPREARACFQDAVRLQADAVDPRFKLACLLRDENNLAEAESHLREVLKRRPEHADALNTLGILLDDTGRHDEAEATYRRALRLRRESPEVLSNLGVALSSLGKYEEALDAYHASLRLKPDGIAAHNNVGNALRQLGRLDEAEHHLRQAVRLKPDYAEAHNNLGIVLVQKGDTRGGVALYDKALELRKDYPEAHLNRALAWLSEGNYERGWDEYEYRWQGKSARMRQYPRPPWAGEPLEGRTVFLHPEQGLGDTLQFLRYARLLAGRGARVVVEVPPPCADLARSCPGVAQVVLPGQEPPPFDYHAPFLGVPRLAGARTPEEAPPAPYLAADPARVEHWRRELAGLGGFRVGIAWQGNPQHKGDRARSVRLTRFAALAAVPGVRLLSLQKGAGREQLAEAAGRFAVADFGARTAHDSLADVAALIAALDLVVCVDTALAHLAGALGRPVWVALPFSADWRWRRHGEGTAWYPSLRLFRQPAPGDWDSVFARLVAELDALARSSPAHPAIPEAGTPREAEHVARALLDNGCVEEAITRFHAVLADNPRSVEALNGLGVAYARQRRTEEAVRAFRDVLAVQPDSLLGLSNLATALQELGAAGEAEAALRQVLRLSPEHPDAHVKLAGLLRRQGRSAEAIAVYRERLRVRGDDAGALNALGTLLEETGKPQDAEQAYREALTARPNAADVHNNLGVALAAQGKWEEALACYQEAVRRQPGSAVFHNNAGNALRQLDRLADAEFHLREAVRLQPDYAEAHNNLGIALVQRGAAEEAIGCYRRALELKPH